MDHTLLPESSKPILEEFLSEFEPVYFEKNEIIKQAATSERYLYFIKTGCIGIYIENSSNFVCLDFGLEGHFTCDYLSILLNKPTPLILIALENTNALRITATRYEQLSQDPRYKNVRLAASEYLLINKFQEQINLLTKTAKERYQLLQEQYPGIENRIAQVHIASYLGITPQSLSRIRSRYKQAI
ncbi:Crp/Fnr family transcriptional regulator [Flavihumibacter sp. RY-1]|uniref:Crp/Fnr family transcriptional regulator n=1 Tax=Flavihumibacter fluminis TaxID=2909236 RepID=A0ABS9BCC5_9BACT|nr:Crp/Fnr family transcriptional regulator [Flavihumibacter fluminis]MCF1713278.1 Crp/Fnr family transcriptional regulator [Flavihumibacter fluminis]